MSYSIDHEIVIKHLLGNISFKTRTRNVDEEYVTEIKTSFEDLKERIIEQIGFDAEYYNGSLTVTLEDAKYVDESHCLTLLINAVQSKELTTVIKQKKTSQRKEITPSKAQGEGYEHSAHVVINTKHDASGTYNILLEKAESIDTSIFKLFINKILFEISRTYEKDYIDKMPYTSEEVRLKPVLEIFSKPDEGFLNEIKNGTISNITLISETPVELRIPDTNYTIRTKESQIKISTEFVNNDVFDYLQKVGKYFSTKRKDNPTIFSKIKVQYKNPNSKDGKGGGTATFNAENLAADDKESIVTKKHIISNFKNQIKKSYTKINEEIMSKMINIITGK